MNKTLTIIVVLAVFSQMNCLNMPSALCNPAKNIGNKVATEVLKCATNSLKNAKQIKAGAAKVKATIAKAQAIASKVGVKVNVALPKLPSEADIAAKIVHAMLAKVGCKRRLNIIDDIKKKAKKVVKKVKKVVKPIAKKVKVAAKKVGKVAVKVVKKVAPVAIKLACKTFGSQCPKACDAGIKQIEPIMKNHKIPVKCFHQVATATCHQSCVEICKGK